MFLIQELLSGVSFKLSEQRGSGAVGASWHCLWGGKTLTHLLSGCQQLQCFWKEDVSAANSFGHKWPLIPSPLIIYSPFCLPPTLTSPLSSRGHTEEHCRELLSPRDSVWGARRRALWPDGTQVGEPGKSRCCKSTHRPLGWPRALS